MEPPVEMVSAVTQPDRPAGRGRRARPNPVRSLARSREVPVLQPERVGQESVLETLASLEPDVIVVAAYGQILPQRLLEIPKQGCVNLHPSLLPKLRGSTPIQTAILEGASATGTTLMLVVKKMDAGPILSQEPLTIRELETAGELAARLADLSADLLVRDLPRWLREEIDPMPQDEASASYTEKLTKADGMIDWTRTAEEIARRVLAFNPWPVAYTFWKGRLLRLLRARPQSGQERVPGHVARLAGDSLLIGTGDGVLALREAQLAGGKHLAVRDLVLGHPELIGATLESEAAWSSA